MQSLDTYATNIVPEIEGHINYHRFAIPPHCDRFTLWQRNTPNAQAQTLSKELLKFPGEIYWGMLRCGNCGVPVDRGGIETVWVGQLPFDTNY